MDLGELVGMDGLVGASSDGGGLFSSSLASADSETKGQKGIFGNGFFKQGRASGPEEHDWRSLKMARTIDATMLTNAAAKAAAAPPTLLRSNSHHLSSDGEQMLSFSSPKPDALLVSSDGTLPFYHHSPFPSSPSPAYLRSAGLRGPFTPSQWMELEHQALIYKYIDANAPIPSNLLLPIRRSLCHSGFPALSSESYRSNPLGWGSLCLGFSGNADPEPGRCRRTDGKKWRCSRDAVADGKYCERHMNRGRHRSRKHVEGQNGHAAKAMPVIAHSPSSAPAVPGGGSSNSLTIAKQCTENSQLANPSSSQLNRMLMSKENGNGGALDSQGFSMLTSANPKPMDSLFPIPKQQNPFEGASTRMDFGLISADSLLNPLRNSYSESTNFATSPELNEQQSQTHSLRHFFDDWPKNRSDRSAITWPEVEEMQSDRTQLSISIPMVPSEFSSSSSSSNQEKLTLSPLKLSREFDPIPMSLSVGVLNESDQRTGWIPISWESSIGGPLGEVLSNTNNNAAKDGSKNCLSSSLNLLTDGWDSSPRIVSSPTGVLQKTGFGSLSSSTGSSPRAESHKVHDSTHSLCDDLLCSTLVNVSTIPSL
ncbi:hypothetical protein J5N97_010091 [Dioscorea zingiberensis]|uniref:Growth-regulating factor n=1 Tax=Dioscorea zingiberensis TaxID=325984 RepID=A0A9D5CYE7_9LILI|nr:hypothetical protein J5N97_010091 [Dioscorea zingiberensis]